MITEKMLKQLKKKLPATDHVDGTEDISHDKWSELGRPSFWNLVEEDNPYIVLKDSAYGYLALFDSEFLVYVGSRTIITPRVIVLDKDYYDTSKYIWR